MSKVRNNNDTFIKTWNGDPDVKCQEDVAIKLGIQPGSVEQRMYTLSRDLGIEFRKLPKSLTPKVRKIKDNEAEKLRLQALAKSFLTTETNEPDGF